VPSRNDPETPSEWAERVWSSLPEQLAPEEVPDWHLEQLAKRRAKVAGEPGAGRPWRDLLDAFRNEM
jgi:hypothetical protein